MQEMLDIIVNHGIGVACVLYMMYFQNTTMKGMLDTLSTMNGELAEIKNDIKHYHSDK